MLVLGIESTCDETACSIVRDGKEILSNVISSQIDLHRQFGGVVPELACRLHVEALLPVLEQALDEAKISLEQIDLIAVAHGPGLVGALLIGVNAAKSLSLALQKPFVGVNHIEAHLYGALMGQEQWPQFPTLGIVLSGGHTSLVIMHEVGKYEVVSQTVDDAIGEAFDKVAKLLGLPYPGGPEVEKLAHDGDSTAYPFKPGRVKKSPLDFSFSGLKTAVLYSIKGQDGNDPTDLSESDKANICASFQETAFGDVVNKAVKAAKEYGCNALVFGGGVTNNKRLKEMFAEKAGGLQSIWPPPGLSLDNAAMIAGLGYHNFKRHGAASLELQAVTRFAYWGE